MTTIKGVYLLAGTMIIVSLSLGLLFSHWWFLLTGFVGVNLFQSAFTGFCPAERILARLGLPEGCGKTARSN